MGDSVMRVIKLGDGDLRDVIVIVNSEGIVTTSADGLLNMRQFTREEGIELYNRLKKEDEENAT